MYFNNLRKLFRLPLFTRTGILSDASKNNYKFWNKEQLITRLEELDNQLLLRKKNQTEGNLIGDHKSESKPFDFAKHNKRFVALKFCYYGWDYNGLALQKGSTPLPTIEGTILQAMNKCKLIPSMIPQEFNFSRCGRTDKGVSSLNQVISLEMRSALNNMEQKDPSNDCREVDYVKLLNQILPPDIRITEVCLRPPQGFDSRFSCVSRHYKYIFKKGDLDINLMSEAASSFQGEHDFRNFCKLDGSKQIENFKRTILSFKILKLSDQFYCFDIIGTAFLWHQVRYMTAILFLVGQKLEQPSIVNDLLDINKYPQRPIYDMASDLPLILYACNFPSMDWTVTNVNDYKAIKFRKSLEALDLNLQIKSQISSIFAQYLSNEGTILGNGKTRINLGDGHGKFVSNYCKIQDRPVTESFQQVNANYRRKKQQKL